MSTPQNYGVTNENEAGNSHNQGSRVDRLRHWWGERRKDVLHADKLRQHNCLARMGQYQRYSGDNMNIVLLTKVRQLFNVDYVPRSTNRHNQKQYIKAIRLLGDKWLTHPHNKIQRIQWLLFILLLRWMFYSLLGWCGSIWANQKSSLPLVRPVGWYWGHGWVSMISLTGSVHHATRTVSRAELVRKGYEE